MRKNEGCNYGTGYWGNGLREGIGKDPPRK